MSPFQFKFHLFALKLLKRLDTSSTLKKFYIFLLFLIISLVGNACADFAFIWYAIAQLPAHGVPAQASESALGLLPSYYLGMSLGWVVLAPVLAVFADRYHKRWVSIALDCTYAVTLVLILAVSHRTKLTPLILFSFSLFTAALGVLHRNVVGFGVLKLMSDKVHVTKLVTKFNAAYFVIGLVGSALAGVLYRWNGLELCIIVAVLSFLPMPFLYLTMFPRVELLPAVADRHLVHELKDGLKFIFHDRILLTNSVCVAIWNISANMFPAIIGIAFQQVLPGRTDLVSYAVAGCILVGLLSFPPMERLSSGLSMKSIVSVALVPGAIGMLACMVYPHPWIFTFAFAINNSGAALLNILSSGVRVKRVPSHLTGRVNTAHTSITSTGQIIGSLCLLPVLEMHLSLGSMLIALTFLISSATAYFFMPKKTLGESLVSP